MYFDWTYIILVMPAVLFTMWASSNVKNTYARYSQHYNRRGITGAQAARRVLDANGLRHVAIERVSGQLSDHYDPRTNIVRLSEGVYDSTSTAAVGVACHEAGHAIQYAVNYAPVKMRTAILPITNLGAKLSMPLIVGGLGDVELKSGRLADLAPTMLSIMGVDIPDDMTGESLIVR